jgi:deazaflavin-dependent oxidoreductase (nitroreductase family)
MAHYQKPGWITKNVFNRILVLLTGLGISVRGSRVLYVQGRKSGEWRSNPVNLLTWREGRYLVAPRGETEWVRNLRAAGRGELALGSKRTPFTARELPDAEKPELLRAYLKLWSMETGIFFDHVKHDAPDAEIARIATRHPVFAISDV